MSINHSHKQNLTHKQLQSTKVTRCISQ